jgi:hypothetical protein
MSVIRFQTNVPVELRLRYLEGKPVESQFGGIQHMFTAEEGSFYVSEAVGQILTEQFRKLGIKAGEPVDITKAEVTNGNRKTIQWQVARVGTPESTSELEKQLAASIAMIKAGKQAQIAQTADGETPRWALALVLQTKHLVDVYAELINYASSKHGNSIRADDIRNMMTTIFINLSKNPGNNSSAA